MPAAALIPPDEVIIDMAREAGGAFRAAAPETALVTTETAIVTTESLVGTALESGLTFGATVGAAGGFEIPVWGWVATGAAVAAGVGYGVYKHYHNKHEADAAAKRHGFRDAEEANAAAKAGFHNAGELHFMQAQVTAEHGFHFTGRDGANVNVSWTSATPEQIGQLARASGFKSAHDLAVA